MLALFRQQALHSGSYTALRLSFVQSLIGHGVAVFLYNEVFSCLDLITPLTTRLYWLIVAAGAVSWLVYAGGGRADGQRLVHSLKQVLSLKRIDRRSRFLIYAGLITLVVPLLVLAMYVPPNNFDSNHYHLNRILYWLNNQNLDHFPTMYVQQLYLNVFAEYLVLHTFLLVGSEHLANLIQFGAMLGSVTAVSLLAKRLGLSYRGQLLAGSLLACLPIGLFESTTTQVDYVACFYLVSFVLFGYWFLYDARWLTLTWCLLALVFGAFTKYPVLFFALPFALFFAVCILQRWGFRFSLLTLVGAGLLFGLVFGRFFGRNYEAFHSLLSPPVTSRLLNDKIPTEKFSLTYSVSNLLKNAGLHLGTPYLPSNLWVESLIVQLHQLLNVSVDDPALSKDHFHVRFSMEEDSAPNTLHFVLLVLTVLILFSRCGHSSAKLLFGLSLAGFVLYCSLFKYQWFNSRIHLQFFALGCVSTAYVWEALLKRSGFYLSLLLYGLALAIVLGNPNKMVIPVRYLAKRVLAHVPRYIGAKSAQERQQLYRAVGTYYKPGPTPDCPFCLSLRQSYAYADRSAIFHKLDSMGRFRHDKEESILFETRTQAYFASHPSDYDVYAPLLTRIGPDVQNVGFLSSTNLGFYHYWSALNQQTDHPVKMAYIRYPHEYVKMPNARRPFCYNYILSDKADLVRQLIRPGDINQMHTVGELTLVHLKRPSCQTYLF